MNNWTQLFGVVLILGHLCISMSAAANIGRTRFFDDGRSIRASHSHGSPKTRRLMMGLGAEMDWRFDRPGSKFSHVKRGTLFRRATEQLAAAPNNQKLKVGAPSESAASIPVPNSKIVLRNDWGSEGQGASDAGSSASKAASLPDSVIVLRNRTRSEGELATGAPNRPYLKSDAASKSGSIPDSAIVLRNNKRSGTFSAASATASSAPSYDSVRNHKRSGTFSAINSAASSAPNSARNHKRSGTFSAAGAVASSLPVYDSARNHKRSDAPNHRNLTPDAASKSATVSDSVIVLRNHKRSETRPRKGAGSSASRPAPISNSVIVLRNHKRSDAPNHQNLTPDAASKSATVPDSVIVLRNHKRSEARPRKGAGSSASKPAPVSNSVIVLRNHKRSDGKLASGATTYDDSVIVLRNHRRSEETESLSQVDRREPEIVLKNGKRSADTTSSGSSFRDSTIVLGAPGRWEHDLVDLSQDKMSQPKMAMGLPFSRRSLRHSSQVPDSSPESTPYPESDSVILPRDVPLSDLSTVS